MNIWKHSVMKNFDERIQEEQHMEKTVYTSENIMTPFTIVRMV